jgi:hypothetical protein
VLLNGIAADMVSRPDLLDRALVVELPSVPDHKRRLREEIWAELEAARPAVCSGLCWMSCPRGCGAPARSSWKSLRRWPI